METKSLINELLNCFKKNKKNIYTIKANVPLIEFFFMHLYNYSEDCFDLVNPNAIYLCLLTYLESNYEKNVKKISNNHWFAGVQIDKHMEELSWKEFKHLYKHVTEVFNLTQKHYKHINEESVDFLNFQRVSRCAQATRPEFEFWLPESKTFDELKEECMSFTLEDGFTELDFITYMMENYTNIDLIEALFPNSAIDKEMDFCTEIVLMMFEEELADYSEELFTKLKYDPEYSQSDIIELIISNWQPNKFWTRLKAANHMEGGKLYREVTSELFALAEAEVKNQIDGRADKDKEKKKLDELEEIFKRNS